MATVLITGANRGLGFEFARQYAAEGWRVHATCRAPERATALRALSGDVSIHRLDVTDGPGTHDLARHLGGEAIDVLIANAGIYIARDMTAENVDAKAWHETFAVNSIAPIVLAGAFLPHVRRSEQHKMLAVTSVAGSVSSVRVGGTYVYRSSKAALNMAWRAFGLDHPELIVALLSPGRIRTEMNPEAPVDPAQSARALRGLIADLKPGDTGAFLRADGGPPLL